jgi:peptidyl-prolyl cis-trans isomerase A (cyclophilin A)
MSRFNRRGLPVLALAMAVAACASENGGGASDETGVASTEQPTGSAEFEAAGSANPLLNPASEAMNATAPDVFQAIFETSKGSFTVEVQRELAPNGADRFYNLVQNGFFDQVRFFRVLEGFVAQFGIASDPQVSAVWRQQAIADDPVQGTNARGSFTYAMAGPNTRTTQIFINFADNSRLDGMGFAPFGLVVEGMDVVDSLYGGYGEGAPQGRGPSQARIQAEGNAYLEADFPELDFVERAYVLGADNED